MQSILRRLICASVALGLVCLLTPAGLQRAVAQEPQGIQWSRLSGNVSYNNGNVHILEAAFAVGEDSEVETAILASSSNLPAAAAACGLAGARKAPVIVTDADALTAEAKYELEQFAPANVIMVGFSDETARKAVKKQVTDALADVEPLVNANLYASTPAACAYKLYNSYGPGNSLKDYFADSHTAVIASAKQLADIVSAGPYAFARQAPVFLSDDGKSLPSDTLEALAGGRFTEVVFVGGTDHLAASVSTALSKAGYGGTTVRWGSEAGADAFATSAAIAACAVQAGVLSYEGLAFASEHTFADAVMGASACGAAGSAVLVVDGAEGTWSDSVEQELSAHADALTHAYVLGTRSGISADFEEHLRRVGVQQTAADLHFGTVALPQSVFAYSGNAVRPVPVVYDASGAIVPSSDYLVLYYDSSTDAECVPQQPGTYTVTANGISATCTNSRSATFTISAPPAAPKVTYASTSNSTVAVKKVAASVKGSLKLPASYNGKAVTSIAANALKGCSKLTALTVKSKKLKSIGKKALFGCKKLKSIKFASKKISKVGAKAFKGVPKTCTVKVPAACVKKYRKLFRAKGLPANAKVKRG